MRQKGANGRAIAAIAGKQHGVISTEQLRAAGLSLDGISRRVRDGRLHRLHQGVYAVGHAAPSLQSRWMAAVISCRRDASGGAGTNGMATVLDWWGAALSYQSAANLWKLLPPREGPVDVSVPGNGGKKRRHGIRVHRSISLLPADVTLRGGIPVTTPARTIADLRRASSGRKRLISPRDLRRAIRQADVLGLPLGPDDDRDGTRSDLERVFLRLCRRHRLPAPEVNVRIGRHLVDFLWRDRMLVVETDGYRYHRGRTAFEDDRARDLALRAQGFAVIRLAEKQLRDDAQRVAEVVGAALRVGADAGRA
jgi:very-short-patch-repair endonuclease